MTNWTKEEIRKVHDLPMMELLYKAATVHREHHNPNEVQVSTLISVKTGNCSEDCGYCSQSAFYETEIDKNGMLTLDAVKRAAEEAKAGGSSRVCMGAAWRSVADGDDFEKVLDMVEMVNDMDMEVCATLGMVNEDQAQRLADAGLFAYNHNLDTSEKYYKEVISTRGFEDRLKTIDNVNKAKINVCSGGIMGMGESVDDRVDFIHQYTVMDQIPHSIPINALIPVEGTPLEEQEIIPIWDMLRMIATTRIVFPKASVRLSAGRTNMTDEGQSLCFFAGANSIFAGDKLLTAENPDVISDMELFDVLGLTPMVAFQTGDKPVTKGRKKPESAEKTKWSRPGHKIERNEEAKQKAKDKRAEQKFEPRKVTSVESLE